MASTQQIPALVGTEEQIRWAERIRRDLADGVERSISEIAPYVEIGRVTADQADAMRAALESWRAGVLSHTEAQWWIEKRSRLQGHGLTKELGAVAQRALRG